MTSDNTRNELLERIGDILLGIKGALPEITKELAEIRMAVIDLAGELSSLKQFSQHGIIGAVPTSFENDTSRRGFLVVRSNVDEGA